MLRLFTTMYSSLLLAIFCFLFVGHMLNTYLIVDIENVLEAEQISAEITLLEKLAPHLSPQQLKQALRFIADKNQLFIEEIAKSDVPKEVVAKLEQQYVWRDDSEYDYFRAFTPKRYFRTYDNEFHPLVLIDDQVEASIWFALLALLAIAASLWFYFFYRKIAVLNRAAIALGKGQLDTRVPTRPNIAIGQLNQSFNHMAERVQTLLSSHKQLTHYIAHELRTPLFRMQLQLELLENHLPPQAIDQLNGLDEDIESLQTMVEELLQYAQIERAELQLKPEEFELLPFCRQLLNNLPPQTNLALEFTQQLPPACAIVADKQLLARAISNVLSNAIKYGYGWLHMDVSIQDQVLQFTINDNGPGIPPAQQQHIFAPFQRIQQHKHSTQGGFGLGLAICANIIQLHKGSIRVENNEKGGACFTLLLPVLTESVNGG